jgi:hypothetical protein
VTFSNAIPPHNPYPGAVTEGYGLGGCRLYTTFFFSALTVADLSRHRVHASDSLLRSNRRAPSTKHSPFVPAPPNWVEVNVNISHDTDQYMIPQPSPCFSYTDSDSQEQCRLHGSNYDGDLESAGEIDLKAMSLPRSHYSSGNGQHA